LLEFIKEYGILTSNNFVLIATHPQPYELNRILPSLRNVRILTQVNFDALLAPNHMALVSGDAIELVWKRIRRHFLTQENFQRLIIAAEHANPMEELERVTNDILGIAPVMAGAGEPGGGAGMGLFAASRDDEDQKEDRQHIMAGAGEPGGGAGMGLFEASRDDEDQKEYRQHKRLRTA